MTQNNLQFSVLKYLIIYTEGPQGLRCLYAHLEPVLKAGETGMSSEWRTCPCG